MKILVDMNLSPLWIDTFNKNGIKAIHWSEIGDSRAKDREIMSWARESGYIVFTHDLNFGHLLAGSEVKKEWVRRLRALEQLSRGGDPQLPGKWMTELRAACQRLEDLLGRK